MSAADAPRDLAWAVEIGRAWLAGWEKIDGGDDGADVDALRLLLGAAEDAGRLRAPFASLVRRARLTRHRRAGGKRTTQAELGAMLGVGNVAVCRWELGSCLPRQDRLLPMARALAIPYLDLATAWDATHATNTTEGNDEG